jgi:hypothetical protein
MAKSGETSKNRELPIITSQLWSPNGINKQWWYHGGARLYRSSVHKGTGYAWSNRATFVKSPIYFETHVVARRDTILRLHQKHTEEDQELHLHHCSSSPSPSPSPSHSHSQAVNRDLLAIGDLVRIFGIDLNNYALFSFMVLYHFILPEPEDL